MLFTTIVPNDVKLPLKKFQKNLFLDKNSEGSFPTLIKIYLIKTPTSTTMERGPPVGSLTPLQQPGDLNNFWSAPQELFVCKCHLRSEQL